MRHKKYRPYVRRANGKERSESMREAFRLTFYEHLGRPFYVMVQRGWPNLVIASGASKRDVQRSPAAVAFGKKSFRTWAKDVQRLAAGGAR